MTSPAVPSELANHPQYRVDRELGRGGMGTVYLARNTLMDRDEVLKVVNNALLDQPAVVERFLREIRAAAKLSHPNVVTAYTALRVGELIVLAMEYAPGEDLGRLVKTSGPLPVPSACYYAYQVAMGLQHAFDRGMVHRDIKPHNLMLVREGRKRTVKILDFGLAKATSEKASVSDLTATGMVLGTPDYIAPEQTLDAATADIRADIYSLGCTLYFLLAGKAPFQAASLYELLRQHQEEAAVPLDRVRGDVQPELATVVARMMAKKPADRFQTPAQAAQAIARFFKPGGLGSSNLAIPAVLAAEPVTALPAAETAPPRRQVTIVGQDLPVPQRTAYLNPEDFDPPARAKPVKKVRKAQAARRSDAEKWVRPAILGGFAVCLLAAGVFGFTCTGGGLRKDKEKEKPPTAGTDTGTPANTTPAGNTKPAPNAGRTIPGFIPLFNGRDKAGWDPHPAQPGNWNVEGDVLVGRGAENSHLYSAREFADFHLRVEARISRGGNGGVAVRAGAAPGDRGVPPCYLAQIDSNGPALTARTGSLFVEREGSQLVPAKVNEAPPSGEWFVLEVIAFGNTVLVRVNGKQTANYTDPDRTFASGRIALEVSRPGPGAGESVIEFRSIAIREMTPAGAPVLPRDGLAPRGAPAAPPLPVPGGRLGFAPLFNGRDLDGWENVNTDNKTGEWAVDGGELVSRGGWSTLFYRKQSFANFHLKARAMIESGDSGIFFRADPDFSFGRPGTLAYEAQIAIGPRPEHRIGSLYRRATIWPAADGAERPRPGEWFDLDVIADGQRLKTLVNGQPAVERIDDRTLHGGTIALQQCTADTRVRFRSIEIKELPE
jgi:tRNA A-37 threonylcarbamoyl transferase component Bud32